MQNKTVLIAFGGASPEHEVSVLTAMQAFAALKESPCRTIPLYISKSGSWYTGDPLRELKNYQDLDNLMRQATPCVLQHNDDGRAVLASRETGWLKRRDMWYPDIILIAFHGADGENGAFQGLCETFNIPYTGSGVMSSSLGMDKVRAKIVCRSASIPVVEDLSFTETEWEQKNETILEDIQQLGYPVVVKPVHLGSSIGVSLAGNPKEATAAIELAFRYDETLLVEKAIQPLMEINCSVLGDGSDCRVSVCERPVGGEELLSFRDKYQNEENGQKGMAAAAREIPAIIPEELAEKIRQTAREIFSLFGASGVARLDFLVQRNTETFYFNEINTVPGSFAFYLWEESGLDFSNLLEELLNIALDRHRRKNGRIHTYETNLLSQKAVRGLKGLKGAKG